MNQYPEELKANLIARMLPPNNVSVAELVRETSIPKDTLYTWRRNAQKGDTPAQEKLCDGLSSEEKFNVVLETASLNVRAPREAWRFLPGASPGRGEIRRICRKD